MKNMSELMMDSVKQVKKMNGNMEIPHLLRLKRNINSETKEIQQQLKEVNKWVVSNIRNGLDEIEMVMLDVKIMGKKKGWNGLNNPKDKSYYLYVPKEVLVSEGVLTKYICVMFREFSDSDDMDDWYEGNFIDWMKDVTIEVNNPLRNEDVKELMKGNKFLWLEPNSYMEMKDFNHTEYDRRGNEWWKKHQDEETDYEDWCCYRLKKYLCERYQPNGSHNHYYGRRLTDEEFGKYLEWEFGIKMKKKKDSSPK